jgi:hypothetical protein
MKKILLLLLLVPTMAWAQSRPIVPGDVGIQVPFGAVGNLLMVGPGTSQIKDSGVASGTVFRVFNVAAYGAVGDGTTDDQGALNSALTACGSAGGGAVLLGAQRYLIDSVGLTVPSRCIVYCPAPLLGNASPTNYQTAKFAVILNSAVTITMSSGSSWQSCPVLQKAYVNNAAWGDYPNLTQRDTLNLVASFAGTGFTWAVGDVIVRDTLIGGFAVGISATAHSARTRLDHVNIDATKCLLLDGSHDISRLSHVECFPFMVGGFANAQTSLNISGIANNGSGLYRVTLSATSTLPVTGDTVWISQTVVGPQSVQARHWTITAVDSTHFDLQGSQGTGSLTTTANTANGSKTVTTLSSTANIGVGQTVTGTGIPGATTVAWIAPNGNDIGISNAATANGTGVTLTFTDTAYASGGSVSWDAAWRNDIGMEFTNSEGIIGLDLFSFGHVTGFHLGTGMNWFSCSGCWNDGPVNPDVAAASVLADSTAKGTTWMGGRLNNTAVRLNSSSGFSTGAFTGINMDSTANNWIPVIEMDQGSATFTGNTSTNGQGVYLFKDAITGATLVGNTLTGLLATETPGGIGTKLQSIGNAFTNTNYAGVAFLKNQQVQIGGGGANCVNANGPACSIQFGGPQVDLALSQVTMTNAGSNSPSGNSHLNYYHATGTITSYTINLPAAGNVGQVIDLFFDAAVTTLTMGGATSTGMPASIPANTWYRCLANTVASWVCGQG